MKKRTFKKTTAIIAALLCSATAIGTISASAVVYDTVEAATNGKTRAQAVEWIKNKLGKGPGHDNVQCVDLIHEYAHYLGQTLPHLYASEYITTTSLPKGWKRYDNTNKPKAGDIFVYDKSRYGAYSAGHVGVILSVDSKGYTCVEYNWANSKVATKRYVNSLYSFSCVIRPNFPNPNKNGWKNENGGWKYYKNGIIYTGWHKMGAAEGEKTEHWSYFARDGKVYTGWRKMGAAQGEKNEHWSYFGPNGWMRTGWQQMGKGTNNPDGNNAKHWSYFGSNGWLRTGLVTLGKADGESVTHKSYFGNNGWLVTNKKFTLSGKTFTADSRGWVK